MYTHPCIIEDFQLSHTAKYWGFLGTHYHAALKCWIVGAVNTEDGNTTSRHYNERGYVNELHAKHEAEKYWEELKAGLARTPTAEERETDEGLLECWNEAARRSQDLLRGRRKLGD